VGQKGALLISGILGASAGQDGRDADAGREQRQRHQVVCEVGARDGGGVRRRGDPRPQQARHRQRGQGGGLEGVHADEQPGRGGAGAAWGEGGQDGVQGRAALLHQRLPQDGDEDQVDGEPSRPPDLVPVECADGADQGDGAHHGRGPGADPGRPQRGRAARHAGRYCLHGDLQKMRACRQLQWGQNIMTYKTQ